MSIVITGDTHGTFDIGKVVRYFNEHEDEYTQDDYLIICGDVHLRLFCSIRSEYESRFPKSAGDDTVYRRKS